MHNIITNCLSVMVFATLIASVCVKHRRRSLQIQSISCLLESLYSLCIGAVTGAVINVINFIRSGLFIGRNRFGRWQCFAILVVFWCDYHGQLCIDVGRASFVVANNRVASSHLLSMADGYATSACLRCNNGLVVWSVLRDLWWLANGPGLYGVADNWFGWNYSVR